MYLFNSFGFRLSFKLIKYDNYQGAWVAQSVKHLTLDFSSGHNLTVPGIEPGVELHADSAEPAWYSLSLSSLSLPLPNSCALSLSLKINQSINQSINKI